MRWWWVLVVSMLGCGSQVTFVGGEGGASPEPPPPDPPERPAPPSPPDDPPRACGAHAGTVEVTVSAGCSYGNGVMEIEAIEAAPEVEGLIIVGDTCAITVAGVGAEIAGDLQLAVGHAVEYRAWPESIWVAPMQVCLACIPCPCPVPLPLLYAADGVVDPGAGLPIGLRTVRVSRGETSCSVSDPEGGCGWEAFALDVATLQIETGGDFDVAPILLGTVAVPEGETMVEPKTGLIATSLRASAPGPTCPSSSYEAAWVVHRQPAPEL